MQKRMLACIGLAVAGAGLLGGCGADAPSRSDLVHALEVTGISTEKAECAADAVLDNLSEDQIVELVERGPAGAPRDDPDRTDDASDQVRAALAACQQVGATTTTTSGSEVGPVATTVVPDPSTSSSTSVQSTTAADGSTTTAATTAAP